MLAALAMAYITRYASGFLSVLGGTYLSHAHECYQRRIQPFTH